MFPYNCGKYDLYSDILFITIRYEWMSYSLRLFDDLFNNAVEWVNWSRVFFSNDLSNHPHFFRLLF